MNVRRVRFFTFCTLAAIAALSGGGLLVWLLILQFYVPGPPGMFARWVFFAFAVSIMVLVGLYVIGDIISEVAKAWHETREKR